MSEIVPKNLHPLTFQQEDVWYLCQLEPHSTAYTLPYLYKLAGTLDIEHFKQAYNLFIQRHRILQTTFTQIEGVPQQVVQQYTPIDIPIKDLSHLTPEAQKTEIWQTYKEFAQKTFDIEHGPLLHISLIRAGENEHYLIVVIHHLVFDGWSNRVFLGEIKSLYDACHHNQPINLPRPEIGYADFARWQRNWLHGENLEKLLDYWKEKLSGELPILDLPFDHPRTEQKNAEGSRSYFEIPAKTYSRIIEICQGENIRPFAFFTLAYSILLMRYTSQDDIIIGSPFASRNIKDCPQAIDRVVGMFVNMVPLRTRLNDNPTGREALIRTAKTVDEAIEHQMLPFARMVSEIQPARNPGITPIFQCVINNLSFPKHIQEDASGREFSIIRENPEESQVLFDLELELTRFDDHYKGALRYRLSLFKETTIERMKIHYLNIIESLLNNLDGKISTIEMLTHAERQVLLSDNGPESDYSQTSIAHLITQQAERFPDTPAITCSEETLTYQEVNRRANQLAHFLKSQGITTETIVGIYLPRSTGMIIAQLAILKAGGAYLPLDLRYPAERIQFMIEDAKPKLVITLRSLASQLPDGIEKLCLDEKFAEIQNFSAENIEIEASSDSLAYVIYTSGSTGRPKGILKTHRGVVNYLHFMQNAFHVGVGDRVLQLSSLSFDVSMRDTLGTLVCGGCIILADDEQMHDPAALLRLAERHQPTCILSVVPTMLRELCQTAIENLFAGNSLRVILTSGEILYTSDVHLAQQAFGKSIEIINQYGPSEFGMIATTYRPGNELPDGELVPIGRAVPNVRVYILDPWLNPVPTGAKGEIWIGGIGLSRGYINQPALTAERFIDNPFASGEKFYRTGDIARRLADGTIIYVGRRDNQIKIRGHRVELGEIEANLHQHPDINDVVVTFRDANKQIGAYFVAKQPLKAQTLREFLSSRLPSYMIPAFFVQMESLPITPSGKLNRMDLPATNREPADNAPLTSLEKRLASLWSELLGIAYISSSDDFFLLGGHSLLAVRLFARIEQVFGIRLPLAALFEHSTLRGLASLLKEPKQQATRQTIVPMQTSGEQTPIFLVPTPGAGPLYMREIAIALSPERPVYGFQLAFTENKHEIKSIEETAEIYTSELLASLPDGPFHLFGHSAGGYIALEMARLLMAQGKTNITIGLIDTYPPGRLSQDTPIANLLNAQVAALKGKSVNEKIKYLRDVIKRNVMRMLRYLPAKKQLVEILANKTNADTGRQLAARTYKPAPFEGNVTLIQATDTSLKWDPMQSWHRYVHGNLAIFEASGNHMSILKQPNAENVARIINKIVDEVEKDHG